MNTIEELIQKECPEGVEFKALGDIGTFERGKNIQKADFVDEGFPCIHYGQIYTYYKLFTDKTIAFVPAELASKATKAHPLDVIITLTSENIEDVCTPLAWLGNTDVAISGHSAAFRHNQDAKYITYFIKSSSFFQQKKKLARGAKVIEIKPEELAKIEIPVPPLSVQHKIVEILDKFTSLEAELEVKLQAELEARKKQYEYYRNQLLDFTGREDVEWKTLGEIAYYPKERISSDELNENNYVSVENLLSNKLGKAISLNVPKSGAAIKYMPNDILIGNIRPYLRKIWLSDIIGGTNGDVVTIRIHDDYKESFIPQFLYYLLSSEDFFNYDNSFAKGGKMPRGDKNQILKYPIPIPPLSEQHRIVTILDKFEELINGQTASLAAEIKARHQQYEYYRDKLLTFRRK